MADINVCTYTGCLGTEPELKKTPDGKSVCSFRLAVTRPKIKGAKKAEVDWFDIVTWNGIAEACAKFLTKGCKVAVTAAARTRTWTDKKGIKRTNIDFVADEVRFFSAIKKESDLNSAERSEKAMEGFEELAPDDELPF